MDRSDVQETLVTLYLRLNGYFVSGFIVHAKSGATTELDVLAVRFPRHEENEREVQPDQRLSIPDGTVDFVIGEVKGGQGAVNFNARFRENPRAIETVLHRIGAFDGIEIARVVNAVPQLLDPARVRGSVAFPEIDIVTSDEVGARGAKLRFIPFAAEQKRPEAHARAYVFGDDLLRFLWSCLRPERRRQHCDDHYNYELWGPQFNGIIRYFKDPDRRDHGTIDDLYQEMLVSS